jgi:hypothetical protein
MIKNSIAHADADLAADKALKFASTYAIQIAISINKEIKHVGMGKIVKLDLETDFNYFALFNAGRRFGGDLQHQRRDDFSSIAQSCG